MLLVAATVPATAALLAAPAASCCLGRFGYNDMGTTAAAAPATAEAGSCSLGRWRRPQKRGALLAIITERTGSTEWRRGVHGGEGRLWSKCSQDVDGLQKMSPGDIYQDISLGIPLRDICPRGRAGFFLSFGVFFPQYAVLLRIMHVFLLYYGTSNTLHNTPKIRKEYVRNTCTCILHSDT